MYIKARNGGKGERKETRTKGGKKGFHSYSATGKEERGEVRTPLNFHGKKKRKVAA